MKRMLLAAVLGLALSTLGAHSAVAQTIDTYMLVPGIPGESQVVGHENWIVVFSVAQSFDESTRSSGACTVAVAKGLDRSGPPLWAAAVTGQTFAEITIDLVKAGSEKPKTPLYQLKLTNARVASIGSSPSYLTEHLTIRGATAKLTYWPQNPDGSPGTPVTATVDCGAMSAPVPMRK